MHFLFALVPRNLSNRQYIAGGILFATYLLASQLASALFVAPAVINPAAGIGLAGLVLEGVVLWPAILLAALLNYLINGSAVGYVIILPIAHALQAIVGSLILKRFDFDPLLRRFRDMFALMGVALIASLIIPTIGLFAIFINHLLSNNFQTSVTWTSWWTGMIFSLLVVAPLIIRWGSELYFRRTWRQIIELVIVFGGLIGLDYALFWWGIPQVYGISLVYVLLLPLFWLAIRIGPRFTILAMFITSGFAMAGALHGPYTAALDTAQLGTRLFQLEIFINILAVIFYIIAALQEERVEATKSLTSYITKLEDALNRLSMQDHAKSDFIAILAHELRNPLAPIVSAMEFMRLTPRLAEEEEALNLMDDRLKTIQRLLDDLLDVSRIERSKINLRKEVVDLRLVLERSVQAIERNVRIRKQTLELDMPREPLVLEADPVRLEQVVSNLLTNASKFTNEGGRLTLSARQEGNVAVVRVADNGIGIEASMLVHIFEPFLQLETGVHKAEGLGIGLSLTQKLVEMHNGTIEAHSAGVDQGSEFVVRLPAMSNEVVSPLPERRRTHVSAALAGTARILVVDDNIPAAQGIGKLLQHSGYGVEYAHTGAEARQKVMSYMPHAVVLDIGLPDIDGYTLARTLRVQDTYGGILLALTGYGQLEDKERAQEAGFDHHLTKPVGIADIVALLPH